MSTKKPTCVFSEPVQIALDELMTELLRRVPEENLADALRVATVNAEKRSRKGRHGKYKTQRFFRKAAERLVNIPDDLAIVVGMKDADPQLELPMSPAPSSAIMVDDEQTEFDAFLTEAAAPKVDDIFDIDVPTFDTFKHVFDSYPYACIHEDMREGKLLVIGYASGRNADGKLLRRNCVLVRPDGTEHSFNDLSSVFGTLSRKGVLHQHIKVLPLPAGCGLRFWTNMAGVGDILDQNRFVYVRRTQLQPCKTKSEMIGRMKAQEPTSQPAPAPPA